MMKFLAFLHVNKYEVLLVSLIQHLFIGVFLKDLEFYTKVIWPINIFIVGLASVGIFVRKVPWKIILRNVLFIVVLALPIALPFFGHMPYFMLTLNIAYVIFFSFIFREIITFLIRPGYINKDIISAAACGYFLLLEISVFLMQVFLYQNFGALNGIDDSSKASVFMDLVYFCSITMTSIGFGDITPNAYYTKLITSFLGIVGQFYSVVLVGILISKFTSRSKPE
ncbi:ion channel [Salmonirosea aquatica]|uniref:Two pore domain potassium channel family protein n=1 Tax=Salmonirosea aquatica TaxID=2654236 RepID=A0A7C9BD70_9BACT|nr:two pore domain potassium channel family protein [Cytophagaceae bacterium SJW1-29]